MANIGFCIREEISRPCQGLVEGFRGIPTSNINDEMNRLYNMHSGIRALNRVETMAGTAVTVKVPAGDNLMLHKALDMAKPGDVLIVDGQGCMERSLAGEIMLTYAWKRGLAGVVVDGVLRDLDGIEKLPIPVYARGITPQGPYKNGPGEINVPVCCGGLAVMPGDIIVGDLDGIVVIRPGAAEEILEKSRKKLAMETKKLEQYRAGNLDTEVRVQNFDKILKEKGVEILH